MGENIAITNNPAVNFTALTEGWYSERYFYDVMSSLCVEKECLHYTQVCQYRSTRKIYNVALSTACVCVPETVPEGFIHRAH